MSRVMNRHEGINPKRLMIKNISTCPLPVLCWLVRTCSCPGFLAAFFLILVLVNPGQSSADQAEINYLPPSIAEMNLVETISGSKASRIINQMHHDNVATKSNYIGRYLGKTSTATYYVSLYDDSGQAEKAMEDMARVMEQHGHGFSHLMKREENGSIFYMALGQGQAHYFFAREIELVWLAVDAQVAEKAIKEIL
jgi:hypothetical protein